MTFRPNTPESPIRNRKIGERIARLAESMGYEVDGITESRISASCYLDLQLGDRELRVRIANHEAKPTYEALNGAADIEVGNHSMAVDWLAAVEQLAEMAGCTGSGGTHAQGRHGSHRKATRGAVGPRAGISCRVHRAARGRTRERLPYAASQ